MKNVCKFFKITKDICCYWQKNSQVFIVSAGKYLGLIDKQIMIFHKRKNKIFQKALMQL